MWDTNGQIYEEGGLALTERAPKAAELPFSDDTFDNLRLIGFVNIGIVGIGDRLFCGQA